MSSTNAGTSGTNTPAEVDAEVAYHMKQLESLLTCPICLDRYRNPKLLPCQHTFCFECLEGCEDIVRRQVKCPECRGEHHIPFKGLDHFPNNLTLQKFLELPTTMLALPAPEGDMAEIIEKFAHYGQCANCEENGNLSKCAHCERKICNDCKTGHIDTLRRETVRLVNQGKRTLPRLIEAIDSLTQDTTRQKQNLDNIKQEIQDTIKRLVKDLQERTELLVSQVENVSRSENAAVSSQLSMLQQEKDTMSNLLAAHEDRIRDPKSGITDEEVASLRKDMFESLEMVRQLSLDCMDNHARVRFIGDYEDLKQQVNKFGEVKVAGGRVTNQPQLIIPHINVHPTVSSNMTDTTPSYRSTGRSSSPSYRPSYLRDRENDSDADTSYTSRRSWAPTNREDTDIGSRYNRPEEPTNRRQTDSTLAIMMRYGQMPNVDDLARLQNDSKCLFYLS